MPVRLFPINVELPDGESITLKVLTSHTIDHVKKLIHDQQDIPVTQQRLFYKSVELDDGDTLLQHSIRSSGSTLTMREPRPTTRMQIHIHQPSITDVISLVADASDTVDSVKAAIEAKEGIKPEQQRLIFNGTELDGGSALSKYKIRNNSVIHLVVKTHGAPRGARVPQSVYVENRGLDMRKPFTLEEVAHLEAGVRKHAQIKTNMWKAILNDDEFSFQQCRTNEHLKDKWRNMCKKDPELKKSLNPPKESSKAKAAVPTPNPTQAAPLETDPLPTPSSGRNSRKRSAATDAESSQRGRAATARRADSRDDEAESVAPSGQDFFIRNLQNGIRELKQKLADSERKLADSETKRAEAENKLAKKLARRRT